ncbi:MAG: hypothetical protein A4E60_03263 [Syntrophorhabdus sp. PtaB.Bin047]|jgi:hypothetical protein|nr:MAG: hypothetical protein A4E60_03263 [Syntrophorhabdus sp. PtaB.Bin047]
MRKSGALLLCMTLWWVFPAFVLALITHPIQLHPRSHLLYVAVLFLSAVSAIVLSIIDRRWNLWHRAGYWVRYALLCGAYLLETVIVIAVLLALDSLRLLAYFGGDAEGSIGMLLIPSAIIYLMAGAAAGAIRELTKRSGRHKGGDNIRLSGQNTREGGRT